MSKLNADSLVFEANARLKRKMDMLDAKAKSSMTALEVRSELEKMRSVCLQQAKDFFARPSPEQSASLLQRLQKGCPPAEVAAALLVGAQADTADVLGRSALHWAVQGDNVAAASLLMDFGAAAETGDATRTLPLHVAAAMGTSGLMAALLLENSPPTAIMYQNCSGWTPLHVASFVGNVAVMRLLLAHRGIDLSLADSEGATPLHAAVGGGQLECVRLLITKGANPNARAVSGDTPLHFAARMGYASIAIVLLKAGADRSQKNNAGIACASMPGFNGYASIAEKDLLAKAPHDLDLPLQLPIPATVPEARSHHFIVDEKAVEAVAGTYVTFFLRTSPPRLGMRFVTRCQSNFDTKVSFGWTTDHNNGTYSVTYRQPDDDRADITVALVEGGQALAKRGFSVATVAPRIVGRFCVGYGPGLYDPQAGANQFVVRARNQCGTNIDKGGGGAGFSATVKRVANGSVADAQIKDMGIGVYLVSYDMPDSGMVVLDVMFQGQSIAGFPVSINMDQQARVAGFFQLRRLEEDIAVFNKKLAAAEKGSTDVGSPAARRHVQRKCVACGEREVCALILPCRHYRYCAACASGFATLETPCKVCTRTAHGFLLVNT